MALSKVGSNQIDSAASLSVTGDLTVDTSTLVVDASANEVGIGTTTPATYTDYVSGSNAPSLVIAGSQPSYVLADTDISGNDGTLGITKSGEDTIINNLGDGNIKFFNNGGERLTIDSSGKAIFTNQVMTNTIGRSDDTNTTIDFVGSDAIELYTAGVKRIDFTNEGAISHVANSANYALFVQNDGNNSNRFGIRITCGTDDGSGTNYLLGFQDGDGNSVGSVTFSGSTTSFNTSSDYRLKENLSDMTGAIDRVKALAPKRFNFIRHPDKTVDGFLAHETQTVVPEAIIGTKDEVDADGNAVYQAIDQSKLVPLLTAALKESIAKIEALETEMTALKARVTALEAG